MRVTGDRPEAGVPPYVEVSPPEVYSRAVEFEPSVTITDETFFSHGWQPTTIAVLQAIWFLPQGANFGVEELATWFGRLGWKSVNGRPFGVEGVRRELALIRKAGYIQANRLRGEGGKVAGIRYEVSKRPRAELQPVGTWIPIEGGRTENPSSDHVPSPTQDGCQPSPAANGNSRSRHVPLPTRPGWRPDTVAGPFLQVAPCAAGKPNPPHPPEEVGTTSSPNPNETGAATAVPSQEDLDTAVKFLMRLPGKWGVGLRRAKNLAPVLLANAAETEWELDTSLRMWLSRREESKPLPTNYPATLEYRIKDLQLRSVALASEAENPGHAYESSAAAVGTPEWCGGCNHGEKPRTVVERTVDVPGDDDAAAPCPRCHPAALAKSRNKS